MAADLTKQTLEKAIETCRGFLSTLLSPSGFEKCIDHLREIPDCTLKANAYEYTACMAMLQILVKKLIPRLTVDFNPDTEAAVISLSVGGFELFNDYLPKPLLLDASGDDVRETAKSSWSKSGIFNKLLDKILAIAEVYQL